MFTSLNCYHLAERNVGWVAPARGTQVGRFPLFLRNVLMVRILERRKGTTSGDNEHPVTGNNQVETILSGVLKRVLFYGQLHLNISEILGLVKHVSPSGVILSKSLSLSVPQFPQL